VGPMADERLELTGEGGDDGDAGHDLYYSSAKRTYAPRRVSWRTQSLLQR
jgi:hypothetical protein